MKKGVVQMDAQRLVHFQDDVSCYFFSRLNMFTSM